MNTTPPQLETDNLVLFPAAKNFKTELCDHELFEDSISDFLNGQNILESEDLNLAELSEIGASEATYDSLEAYMARHQSMEDDLASDEELLLSINESMKSIIEAKERLKFYLDDLEMFLPTRR